MALAQSYNGLRWDYRLARDGLDPLGPSLFNDLPDVIVVSAGAKHHFQNYRDAAVDDALKWRRILPEALIRERSIKVVDLRQLHDESKGVLGSHTGRHPGIISQLLASRAGRFYLNDEYKFIRECVERGERVLLLAFCISNRHRSVAFATCVGAAFWPMPVMVIHLDTYVDNNWQTMRCGGRCDQCGERFQSAASLHNQVISHLSPAALGPLKAQQVRQRSMPPDPAAHAFPRSSTPGPAAPIYHRLRAASVSGAASSNEIRRPAEPPSTPRATRAAPPVATKTEITDFTVDDPDQGVEYWKTRAIRAEAQTDMYKDELRMVRAEADALRERAAAAKHELIVRYGDESDRSRSRSASRATSRQTSRGPCQRPGRMGARHREESIKEEPDEQEEPSDVVMEEKEEEEHCEIPGLNRPVKAGDESWAANLTPGGMILLGNSIRRMLRDTGKATVDRDGWFGPVGAGGNSGDVLFPQRPLVESTPWGRLVSHQMGSILGRSLQDCSSLQLGIRPGTRRRRGDATAGNQGADK